MTTNMPEQPPQTICEICGGIHATSVHIYIAEKPTDTPPVEELEDPSVIDVQDILDTEKEVKERLIQTIREDLEKELSGVMLPNEELDDFVRRLREKYNADKDALAIINEKSAEKRSFEFIGFKPKKQAETLYNIASFLKGRSLDPTDTVADVRQNLQGKRILVLGDDTGSLSELLRHYGAESFGIENDKFSLLIAHSGLLSLNGQPQEQVLEGNIGDFFEGDATPLLERLYALGPFDMIVSDYTFNDGSGVQNLPAIQSIDKAANLLAGHIGRIDTSTLDEPASYLSSYSTDEKKDAVKTYKALTANFRKNCDRLLADDGLQLHLRVDMEHLFDIQHSESPNYSTIIVPKNPQHRKSPKFLHGIMRTQI